MNIFKEDKYCFEQILEARRVFTDSRSTPAQIDSVYKMLGIMFLYCSETLENTILATMEEIDRRILLGELWRVLG